MTTRWSRPADIEAKISRQWRSGNLLRDFALGEPFTPVSVPLRGPRSDELADHLAGAREWAAALYRASRGGRSFDIVAKTVGGRHLGRTEIPGRAVISTYDQAWDMLGVRDSVNTFDELLAHARHVPAARSWALKRPLAALSIAPSWPHMLAARDWLEWNRDSGRFLREVDAPGVDTKFIERHRSALAEMLGVSAKADSFLAELGLARKPPLVRLRFAPETLGMPEGITEATLRLDELLTLQPRIRSAFIVENEVTFLSAPIPHDGVVLWGRGYHVDHPASLRWLAESRVIYWGDLDTHGFAILNRVRNHLPQTQSLLMDRETLVRHEARWGAEPSPTTVALPLLTETEASLYHDLVTDRYGPSLRLEQERIDWAWVESALQNLDV